MKFNKDSNIEKLDVYMNQNIRTLLFDWSREREREGERVLSGMHICF